MKLEAISVIWMILKTNISTQNTDYTKISVGSTTISLGFPRFSQISMARMSPLRFATSILCVPESVQYNL
ncbi:unnamed protein product [Larinioides sclopetarius]|uniref:Uncharacterized protein n=1 Tax=Larinioides sclopetarius TaxID=280406 RepID=A0AAV1ZAL1_9ARAC